MKNGKVYSGITEESVRFANFKANADIFVATKAKNLTYSLVVIKFSDPTPDEFAATYTRLKTASLWRDLPCLNVRIRRSGVSFIRGLDDARKGDPREEPRDRTVLAVLFFFHHGCSRGRMGAQHGLHCVTERAAVFGLRPDRFGL